LHPSCALIVWLAAVLALPAFGYIGSLALAAVLLLASGGLLRPWWSMVRRVRWLLLTLWLILAYNVPGEAFADLPWAPTYEGIAAASLHALRLIVMLGCLAWLFHRLGRDGLVSALWGLLHPCRALGLDTERLVVRLSLVLDNLQTEREKGAWRRMLGAATLPAEGPASLHLALPRWAMRDSLLAGLVAAGLLAVLCA
jgi:energy-coupling factor transporter transmembrane protein EcfT